MRLFLQLCAAAIGLLSYTNGVDGACQEARVRKNWDSYTDQEKETYQNALAAAMDSGEYIKFVEIHMEQMSEREAHGQCMFLYWHRLFILGFENMLRAQGPEFECVTLPYWDWITANNRMTNGECENILDCSTITQELGGIGSGSARSLTINGRSSSGTCVDTYPLDHFCESRTAFESDNCAHCVTRGDWASTQIPRNTAYSSVLQQIFSAQDIGTAGPQIERGCHNPVHANMGGAMTTVASPYDPIFFSHHAMVDLLQTIFFKCKVGTKSMTFEEKAGSVGWSSCNRRGGDVRFQPTDNVVMRTTNSGGPAVSVWDDNEMSKYFPSDRRYAALMDAGNLGESSYTYEVNGYLATMYNGCNGEIPSSDDASAAIDSADGSAASASASTDEPSASASSGGSDETTAPPSESTDAPATTSPLSDSSDASGHANEGPATASPLSDPSDSPAPTTDAPAEDSGFDDQWGIGGRWGRWPRWMYFWLHRVAKFGHHGRHLQDCDPQFPKDNTNAGISATPAPTTAPVESNYEAYNPSASPAPTNAPTDAPTEAPESYSKPLDIVIGTLEEKDESTIAVVDWYVELLQDVVKTTEEPMAEMERISCVYYDECYGPETPFTPEAIEWSGQKESRCASIVKAIAADEQKISFENWRDATHKRFGCPQKGVSSASETSDKSDSSNEIGDYGKNDTDAYSDISDQIGAHVPLGNTTTEPNNDGDYN